MRSSSMRVVATVLVALAVLGVRAGPARAEGAWSQPVSGSSVLVRYGELYEGAGGTMCTHRGLDLAATSGSRVAACAAGDVTFAGLVPGEAGGRTIAVTIAHADGLRTTYMPLETCDVAAGEQVEAGDALGTLAASGDASSECAHLHLSVRRGEAYLDPSAFLAPLAVEAPDTGSAEEADVAEPVQLPAAPVECAPPVVIGCDALPAEPGASAPAVEVGPDVSLVPEDAAVVVSEPDGMLVTARHDVAYEPTPVAVARRLAQAPRVLPFGPALSDALVAAAGAALVSLAALYAAHRGVGALPIVSGVVPAEIE